MRERRGASGAGRKHDDSRSGDDDDRQEQRHSNDRQEQLRDNARHRRRERSVTHHGRNRSEPGRNTNEFDSREQWKGYSRHHEHKNWNNRSWWRSRGREGEERHEHTSKSKGQTCDTRKEDEGDRRRHEGEVVDEMIGMLKRIKQGGQLDRKSRASDETKTELEKRIMCLVEKQREEKRREKTEGQIGARKDDRQNDLAERKNGRRRENSRRKMKSREVTVKDGRTPQESSRWKQRRGQHAEDTISVHSAGAD